MDCSYVIFFLQKSKNKITSTKITMNLVAYNPGPATWDHKPSQVITQNYIVTYVLKALKHHIIYTMIVLKIY